LDITFCISEFSMSTFFPNAVKCSFGSIFLSISTSQLLHRDRVLHKDMDSDGHVFPLVIHITHCSAVLTRMKIFSTCPHQLCTILNPPPPILVSRSGLAPLFSQTRYPFQTNKYSRRKTVFGSCYGMTIFLTFLHLLCIVFGSSHGVELGMGMRIYKASHAPVPV